MSGWRTQIGRFLTFYGRQVLRGAGKMSAADADRIVNARFEAVRRRNPT